ncbi:hypothetical protein ISF_07117 [Cordyceps fumosorosea ARSEF 2679]|uniref:Uncharacterized protein n=1 Tax=Cordyceps fumosorosea (strain ARSEF 2679) TaxID=1081104 RepID=A0A167Q1D6_CORFA|nr:hypothetical protein ISF_07117 [Cordyceps fumosorosea ARSEF 2679]OAA57196.1 hypothetical protein ISF_07117 [Cordyceps fumosorosea ARSEF 2679]
MKFSVALTTAFVGFVAAGPVAKRDPAQPVGGVPESKIKRAFGDDPDRFGGLIDPSTFAPVNPPSQPPSGFNDNGVINPADFGIGPPPGKTKRAFGDDPDRFGGLIDPSTFAPVNPPSQPPSSGFNDNGVINPADFGIGPPPGKTKRAFGDDPDRFGGLIDPSTFAPVNPPSQPPSGFNDNGVINPADFGIGPPPGKTKRAFGDDPDRFGGLIDPSTFAPVNPPSQPPSGFNDNGVINPADFGIGPPGKARR